MPVNYSTTTITLNPAWRVTGRGMGDVFSGIMAAGNGTTNYGIVREGTILARHSGTDLMHPCGAQELTVFGSLNLLTMHDARNFYVSDVVSVYDSSGNVKAAARNVTIVDKTDPTHTVTVDGAAITIAAGDVILKDNELYRPVGILINTVDTTRDIEDQTVTRTPIVDFQLSGDIALDAVIGLDTAGTWLNGAMKAGQATDAADSLNAWDPEHNGFAVLANY